MVNFATSMTLQKCLLLCLLTCCGHALGSEIIHGKAVRRNSMQYMVSLQNKDKHVCGGFLVSEDFVLTAAHCVNWNFNSVVLGTHNLKKVNQTMRLKVKRCMHPSFKSVGTGNDIMLLKLLKKPLLGKAVRPIKLPKSTMKFKNNAKFCVAGWGSTKTGGPTVNVLQKVDVNIIDMTFCEKKWKTDRFKLPANVICAGGFGTKNGFCQGDSGGPLVYNGMAVGIVSFNKYENCTYPGAPNIYTDISKFLPWINKILRQHDC